MSEYDELVKRLQAGAADPMWSDHCEMSKRTAMSAANAIQSLQARVKELEADADRWHTLKALWAASEQMTLEQPADGSWLISQFGAIDESFPDLRADSQDGCIDQARQP